MVMKHQKDVVKTIHGEKKNSNSLVQDFCCYLFGDDKHLGVTCKAAGYYDFRCRR